MKLTKQQNRNQLLMALQKKYGGTYQELEKKYAKQLKKNDDHPPCWVEIIEDEVTGRKRKNKLKGLK